MALVDLLWQLQELDSRHDALERQLRQLPIVAEMKELKTALTNQQAVFAQAAAALVQQGKNLREQENEIRDIDYRQKQIGDKLYGGEIRNLKEMEQLEKKLDQLRTRKAELEDAILQAMVEEEKARGNYRLQDAKLQAMKRNWQQKCHAYSATLAKVKEELTQIELARGTIAGQIASAVLAKYDRLRRTKQGIAVAKIDRERCSGCRVTLPTELADRAMAGREMTFCENCGRILYWVCP